MMSFSKMIAVGFLMFAMMAGQTAPIAAGQTPAITVPENGTPEEIVRFLFLFYDPRYQESLRKLGFKANIDAVEFLASESLKNFFQILNDPALEDHCGACLDGDLVIGGQTEDDNFKLDDMFRAKNLQDEILIDAYILNSNIKNFKLHRFFRFLREDKKWRIDNIYNFWCQNSVCEVDKYTSLRNILTNAIK